ncbi:MAG: MOSC domain-containing protein [Verrucomicrobium sp.]|nr:MOSC domain-containing protein [Verrucomicrobium sp.]
MKVLSVNRSLVRTVEVNGKEVPTGIYKEPVETPVQVHKLGLEGDGQADLKVHGGPFQAVYAYPVEHYEHWQQELGQTDLEPGTFGENITVSGLLETEVCIGDTHRVGGLVLQVTCERIPCFKLGHKLNRPDILKPFLQSGRSGFYYRVIQEGAVAAGDTIEVIEKDPRGVTVRALLGMHRLNEGTPEDMRTALQIEALSPLVRADFEARLEKN